MNPMSIDMLSVEPGAAILIVGTLALLLWILTTVGNVVGMIFWGFSIVMVAVSALFGLGIELVYFGVLLTAVLTITGLAFRVIA